MKNIEVIELKVSALSGTDIGECMKESIELAAKEWRNVILIHNKKSYSIKPNDLIGSITKMQ
jgi:hypothetical protein